MILDNCRSKIDRASEHLQALDELVDGTFADESNVPVLGTRAEPNTSRPGTFRNSVYVSFAPNLSEMLNRAALLLGDAVHNLRTALNYLAFEVSIDDHGQLTEDEEKDVGFPICKDQPSWMSAAGQQLRFVSQEHLQVMESLQPFNNPDTVSLPNTPAGFHPLLALERLDIIDKHRTIPVVIGNVGGFSTNRLNPVVMLAMMTGGLLRQAQGVIPLVEGAELASFVATGDPLPNNPDALPIEPLVSLEDGTPVVAMLKRIRIMVEDAIERMEASGK
jgi:hypothetical protein